jgi:hypothetical protein
MNLRGKNASTSECRAIFSAYGRRPGQALPRETFTGSQLSSASRSEAVRKSGVKPPMPSRASVLVIRLPRRVRSPTRASRSRLGRRASSSRLQAGARRPAAMASFAAQPAEKRPLHQRCVAAVGLAPAMLARDRNAPRVENMRLDATPRTRTRSREPSAHGLDPWGRPGRSPVAWGTSIGLVAATMVPLPSPLAPELLWLLFSRESRPSLIRCRSAMQQCKTTQTGSESHADPTAGQSDKCYLFAVWISKPAAAMRARTGQGRDRLPSCPHPVWSSIQFATGYRSDRGSRRSCHTPVR